MNRLLNSKGAPCVSITGAAKLLGISRQAVSQLVAKGRLPVERYQVSGGYGVAILPIAAVQAWRRHRARRLTRRKGSA